MSDPFRQPAEKPKEEAPVRKLDAFSIHERWLAVLDIDLLDIAQVGDSPDRLAALKYKTRDHLSGKRLEKTHPYFESCAEASMWFHTLTVADCAELSRGVRKHLPEMTKDGIFLRGLFVGVPLGCVLGALVVLAVVKTVF